MPVVGLAVSIGSPWSTLSTQTRRKVEYAFAAIAKSMAPRPAGRRVPNGPVRPVPPRIIKRAGEPLSRSLDTFRSALARRRRRRPATHRPRRAGCRRARRGTRPLARWSLAHKTEGSSASSRSLAHVQRHSNLGLRSLSHKTEGSSAFPRSLAHVQRHSNLARGTPTHAFEGSRAPPTASRSPGAVRARGRGGPRRGPDRRFVHVPG
jgi:hypothetical protein